MKQSIRKYLFLAGLTLSACAMQAQTEVTTYQPGITPEGITYFLPVTQVRVVVTATKTHHTPGEMAAYAARYLRLNNVTQTAYDSWKIDRVELVSYGVADKSKAYSIKVKTKTSAPLVGLATDGRLFSVNAGMPETEPPLPVASVTPIKQQQINGADFKTEEILSAGSMSKMAELTAAEIADIRENRSLLTKGQADFMPKDGEQLRLMLANLDQQEAGLLQLFRGSEQKETHVFVYDIQPQTDVKKQLLCNFSPYLGPVAADDPAGAPIYYSISDQKSLPPVQQVDNSKKKEAEDLRYVVPSRVKVCVFNDEATLATEIFPMAQFGRIEHLGGDLFNKKYTTRVFLSPQTGGLVKLDAQQPR